MTKSEDHNLVYIALDKLDLHPWHDRFPAMSPARYEQFLASMRVRQKDPVEVVPSQQKGRYVVVDGRHRVRAARELRKQKLLASVRDDIDPGDEVAIRRALLDANRHRRLPGLIEQVEVLLELEPEATNLDIAAIADCTDRQVRNLRKIVLGPDWLLVAAKNKAISEETARKILKLSPKLQAKCQRIIEHGAAVKEELETFLSSQQRTPAKQVLTLDQQLAAVQQAVDQLCERPGSLSHQQGDSVDAIVATLAKWRGAANMAPRPKIELVRKQSVKAN